MLFLFVTLMLEIFARLQLLIYLRLLALLLFARSFYFGLQRHLSNGGHIDLPQGNIIISAVYVRLYNLIFHTIGCFAPSDFLVAVPAAVGGLARESLADVCKDVLPRDEVVQELSQLKDTPLHGAQVDDLGVGHAPPHGGHLVHTYREVLHLRLRGPLHADEPAEGARLLLVPQYHVEANVVVLPQYGRDDESPVLQGVRV